MSETGGQNQALTIFDLMNTRHYLTVDTTGTFYVDGVAIIGGGYPPDNTTINLSGLSALQIKLSNPNSWTGEQSFNVIKPNTTLNTVTGSTSGSIVWSEPEQGTSLKKVVLYADNYRNSTMAPQVITFTTAFTNNPTISVNDTGMILGVSTTGVGLPMMMSGASSGNIIIEGF